jgi:hypothetical protein
MCLSYLHSFGFVKEYFKQNAWNNSLKIWKHYICPKRRFLCINIHFVVSQKTVIFSSYSFFSVHGLGNGHIVV